ncbi:MAG: BatD family protein, partial [Gammaproteobacteria bacterium]|nr:BatD family protein [Gammaproteobacteria bacterium]
MTGFFAKILGVSVLLMLAGVQQVMAEVEVNIDRNPVQVNESFQLVFSLDQSPDREPDFSILQQHFLILSNNRSNSISIINGEYQRSVKWTLQLMAKQIGEYMIPAIRFDKERSKPFQIKVLPSSLASVPQDQLVLELLVDKPEAYVQSQVIVTLRLLSATNVSAYNFGDISTDNLDVVIEPLGDERQYQTRIADKSYLVLEKQFALFPQQAGRLGLEPVMAEVRLSSSSAFDPFRTGGEIKRLRSQPVFIDVEPIPPEFAGSYWLPASGLELREAWQSDLDNLVAGEPITRSLTLVADGLTAAQLPELELARIDGIKQYPDQPVLLNRRSNQGISGKREQKVALIPGAGGTYRVPEISLSWWNLESGKPETATIPAREISVNAAASVAVAPPVTGQSIPEVAPPVAANNKFWLWLSLLLACGWLSSGLYWWFKSRTSGSPDSRAVEQPGLRAARKQLRQACEADDPTHARHALLDWGRALLDPREVNNLHQLGLLLGDDLARQVEWLNQSLYAGESIGWQGRELWLLCQQLEETGAPGGDRDIDELLP